MLPGGKRSKWLTKRSRQQTQVAQLKQLQEARRSVAQVTEPQIVWGAAKNYGATKHANERRRDQRTDTERIWPQRTKVESLKSLLPCICVCVRLEVAARKSTWTEC